MTSLNRLRVALLASIPAALIATGASAENFNIPAGPLETALDAYSAQTGIPIMVANQEIRGIRTRGVKGDLSTTAALARILTGTGFESVRDPSGSVGIARAEQHSDAAPVTRLADAVAPVHAATSVETVVVTSSKIKGDIQTVPIAITALSQEQLTSRQIAGGPDLVKEVPNLTFTKTNFTGYSISIRGIGTQAISVATDPAVAVALNDIPFIRNHFFEQEFYDVNQVEVVRGPQGTLYGRNATAGVVNVISAKPTDQFEAMLSADWGNYTNRRYEGMVNIPIVEDRLDLRVAGEWTKRDGYTTNSENGQQVDGRDLWSTRVTLGIKPMHNMQAYLVWEHFQESDDRMRTAKQLCHTDPGLPSILGQSLPTPQSTGGGISLAFSLTQATFGQGCLPASMYSPEAFEVPNGYSLPYITAGELTGAVKGSVDPYASIDHKQSRDLRVIETQINPRYDAKNNTLELNVDYTVTPALTISSQTGYNQDFLWSTEDYNRFNTSPGIFQVPSFPYLNQPVRTPTLVQLNTTTGNYEFCDPQLGCSDRIVAQDLSKERAWQLSQEFRLASNFTGPFNFSAGGNYMHYETVENYYVFANTLTELAAVSGGGFSTCNDTPWVAGVTDNHECLGVNSPFGYQYHDAKGTPGTLGIYYIDPNPLGGLNDKGHSYFLSQNPYVLNSYAAFGEAYYNLLSDLKLTGGIRWTDDQKHFIDIPSELLVSGYGYSSSGTVDQQWNQLTGRLAANWTPKLDFTDQTLVYGSWAHGYKAGGANPPGAIIADYSYQAGHGIPIHPLTFKPEFIDAYELGTKNTLLDGGLTLNGDVFFYNYTGYQISRIVDRTAINDNFNATVRGAELEASYEPLPGLKFNFAGGYEATRIKDGQSSVDLMDRTDKANHPDWVLMRPFITVPSSCIFPDYVAAALIKGYGVYYQGNQGVSACGYAYNTHLDPATVAPYTPYPTAADFGSNTGGAAGALAGTYPGYDPLAGSVDPLTGTITDPYTGQNTYNGHDYGPAPNNGAGFAKNVGGNQLPNAPHFTASFAAEYTLPVSEDWAASLHGDFYWQSQSYARVFNDNPYDKIRGYSNVNLALILTSASGWQVMGYLKNVFDTTAITGTFLNSDDSGLTTNVFLTDPRLYGVRITKNW